MLRLKLAEMDRQQQQQRQNEQARVKKDHTALQDTLQFKVCWSLLVKSISFSTQ